MFRNIYDKFFFLFSLVLIYVSASVQVPDATGNGQVSMCCLCILSIFCLNSVCC